MIVDPDPAWAARFAEERARIAAVLGPVAHSIEHIGSTSVPGLAAKPIVDVLVTVEDITAEEDYLAPLLGAGYVLRTREPGHRLVRTPALDVHVHVLEADDPAAEAYLELRDRLRRSPEDRTWYEAVKRELAARDWPDMNAYSDAKTSVIEAIRARARVG